MTGRTRHVRALRGRRADRRRRNAIRLLDAGMLPEGPMVVLTQRAAHRARRDDPIALLME